MLLADQILSSATNAVLAFSLLLVSDASDFGRVSLAIAVVGFVVGINRAGPLESLVIGAGSRVDTKNNNKLVRDSGLLGGIAAIGAAIAVAISGGTSNMVIASGIYALCMPLVDQARYSYFAGRRYGGALLLDGAWIVGFVIWIAGALLAGRLTIVALLIGYSFTGVAAWALSICHKGPLSPIPGPRAMSGRAYRKESGAAALDYVLNAGAGYAVTMAAPLVVGVSGLGTFKAVLTLFQPALTLTYALRVTYLRSPRFAAATIGWLWAACGIAASSFMLYALGVAWVLDLFEGVVSGGALASISLGLLVLGGVAEGSRAGMQVFFDWVRVQGAWKRLLTARIFQSLLMALSLLLGYFGGVSGLLTGRAMAHAAPYVLVSRLRAAGPRANG
jgi:hypothetical protein